MPSLRGWPGVDRLNSGEFSYSQVNAVDGLAQRKKTACPGLGQAVFRLVDVWLASF